MNCVSTNFNELFSFCRRNELRRYIMVTRTFFFFNRVLFTISITDSAILTGIVLEINKIDPKIENLYLLDFSRMFCD